ncbi:MAG: tRNA (N6-isopentenyl adenosine(37)-C2)-methylthiotransferase MiaB [Candidatus Electryonea clarkiae]|nr:tRNA (N6-isopentenyl adenosine(37)-C2)-methylthiotransferase MiaB [Candidatus Electryonea clarkiae]MDP8288989.1 tRNA (N6-isopentenyl adenosine(37)-C2)-methylthiotransferase MiaB [Candidatus Electryonea clarkiae]
MENFKSGKIFIETYGCQMNLADSEVVMSLLEEQGYERTFSAEDAGIILVNTCIVREHAQEKAITNISQFRRYKKKNNGVRVGVLGCMASGAGETLAERLPFLDWIIGPDAYRILPEIISSPPAGKPLIKMKGADDELYDEIGLARREGINAWVVITRGCDNFCTYCVVPHARGKERYRPVASIIKEVKTAVQEGFPQVTLLGQNVNSWRDENLDFADLLKQVSDIENLKRVRFITSHPKDCSMKLLNVMSEGGKICPELHLPVQSGSNRILQRMGRGYTREHYLDLVKEARDRIPRLHLSSDIIVGFPGETESDYLDTKELVRDVQFDDAFVYRYSERPGTAAAKFDDDIPEEVKISRLMKIGDIVRKSGKQKLEALIGQTATVLVEGISTKSLEESMGKTRAGHVVVFPGKDTPRTEVNVILKQLSGFTLRGEKT